MAGNWDLTDASVVNLYKEKYKPMSDNMSAVSTPLLGRIKRSHDNVGKQVTRAIPFGWPGGSGCGTLPQSNRGAYDQAVFTTKKVYTTAEVDRRSLKQANNEGAFVNLLTEVTRQTVLAHNNFLSSILFNDHTGDIGTLQSVSDAGGGVYNCVITAATWKVANFFKFQLLHAGASSDLFEVTSLTPSTRTVQLTRFSGSYVPTSGTPDHLYHQGSYSGNTSNEPEGIRSALDATSGTLYTIPVGYLWQATQIAAGGAGIVPDLINQALLDTEATCGETPNLIVMHQTQMRKILNQLEDLKRYTIPPRNEAASKANLGFPAVMYMSSQGPIPMVVDRYCETDRVYCLNDEYIEMCYAPGDGWFQDDGTVWMRKAGADAYTATYGGYLEFYIVPTKHAVIDGLAT